MHVWCKHSCVHVCPCAYSSDDVGVLLGVCARRAATPTKPGGEARAKLGPQKLTNKERRKKRRDKKKEVVAQKREKGTLKTSKKKERAQKAGKKGTFKSKKRYKRR